MLLTQMHPHASVLSHNYILSSIRRISLITGSYLEIFSWGGNMGWCGVQVGAVIRESNMGKMGWCGVGAV